MQPIRFLAAVGSGLGLVACGEPVDDPSAYTELGLPDARYQLGWGVEDVPWDTMSPSARADVLRNQLVVLRARARDRETRRAAGALLRELRGIDLYDEVDDGAALDSLRDEVERLDGAGRGAHEGP